MKRILCAFMVALLPLSFAQANVSLQPGKLKSAKAVDVSNSDGTVTLRLQVKTKTAEVKPSVSVQEFDGMTCEVTDIKNVISTLNPKTQTYSEVYDIDVIWYPGVQWSSCLVEVTHPATEKAGVSLFVEGDYNSDRGYDGYDY